MVSERVAQLRSEIARTCVKAGRKPEEVTLVAVTKTVPVEMIEEAIAAGIVDMAENRVQEAQSKFPGLVRKHPNIHTHLIGHLQSNKARDAIQVASLIHSVDSLKLAEEIERQAVKQAKTVDCLVQINTAREEQKFGAAPEEADALVESIGKLEHLRVKGLMTMAPYTEDESIIRTTFSDLRAIRERMQKNFSGHPRVSMGILSMGMSGDYKIAIEEGSTMVRVGSAIFK